MIVQPAYSSSMLPVARAYPGSSGFKGVRSYSVPDTLPMQGTLRVGQLRYAKSPYTHVHIFGMWKETRVPAENLHRHGENVQTPCRPSGPSQESIFFSYQCYDETALFEDLLYGVHSYTIHISRFWGRVGLQSEIILLIVYSLHSSPTVMDPFPCQQVEIYFIFFHFCIVFHNHPFIGGLLGSFQLSEITFRVSISNFVPIFWCYSVEDSQTQIFIVKGYAHFKF